MYLTSIYIALAQDPQVKIRATCGTPSPQELENTKNHTEAKEGELQQMAPGRVGGARRSEVQRRLGGTGPIPAVLW